MIVNTTYGGIEGIKESSVFTFKGIPYAKPPIGPLRFSRPEKPEPWNGIFQAKDFGYRAIQQNSFAANDLPETSEDCLTLNIATTSVEKSNKPVVVWIHGGQFTYGSGLDYFYKGINFVRNGDIVFLTVNYRLGALGFLHLGNQLGENYEASGNCGILDIIEALQWVKENISHFGGNPDNVTIMGESAGGKCAASLLIIPEAKGLFHKAIIESGSIQAIRDKQTAARITSRLLKELRLSEDEAFKLKTIPAKDILEAQNRIAPGIEGLHIFGPVIDNKIIVESPLNIIRKGNANKVKVLIGTNKDECNLFTATNDRLANKDRELVSKLFGVNSHIVWRAYENSCKDTLESAAWNEVLTDYIYRIASTRLMNVLAEMGWDVWAYRFDFQSSIGAVHAMELPFIFINFELEYDFLKQLGLSPTDFQLNKLGKIMHNAWISFIKEGNPHTKEISNWNKYSTDRKELMVFDKNCRMDTFKDLREDELFPDQVLTL
ncbi:MAG: carboxylesterase/lipase family protein [Bacillota bacterium]|nr:carboxylesterase/lipase family protein [Bacillota bacterium]